MRQLGREVLCVLLIPLRRCFVIWVLSLPKITKKVSSVAAVLFVLALRYRPLKCPPQFNGGEWNDVVFEKLSSVESHCISG